jgi:general secretion pathway protein C
LADGEPLKTAGSLATLAASALLGVVLAYWSWAWLAPQPLAQAVAVAESSAEPRAGGLFGSAKQMAGAASGSVRLTGIIASGDAGGQAVLRIDGRKTVSVPQGEEVEPGLRLKEVHVDRVVLERNGVRETLAWPEKGK